MKIRLIMVIVLLFCLTLISQVFASTMREEDFKCPVCGSGFKAMQNMSYSTFGVLRDFQKEGAISGLYENMIISCPKCHFAGYPGDFGKAVDKDIKEKVLKELKTINPGKPLDDITECEFAAKIYLWKKAENQAIGHIYLTGSYLLRNATGENKNKRMKLQEQALEYLKKAIGAGEIKKNEDRAAVTYLVGELYRRTGKFDEAIKWYDKALGIKELPEGLKKWAKEQKAMAEKKDANNSI